jgi:hypothetical protein
VTVKMSPGQKLDVEIRSPITASEVRINGEPVRVRSIKVEAVAGEISPLVTLELWHRPDDEPILLSGRVIAEKPKHE